MTKDKLIKVLQEVLDTGETLDILLVLRQKDLERLVAIVR
jgi:hypothetical protein